MRKLLLILLSLVTVCFSTAQTYKLKLFKKDDFSNFVVDLSLMKNAKKLSANDSIIILKKNIKLREYKIFERTLQNVVPNRYNTIRFLVGYRLNEMFMVFDNNHNSILSDDSVYTYKVKKSQMSNREFRNSLPIIRMDSLEIKDSANNTFYYSNEIRICPTLKKSDWYSGYTGMPKTDDVVAILFSDSSYFTKNFEIKGETYHIELIPHPIVFPVYPVTNSDFSRASIALIKHVSNDSFTMVGSSIVEFMLINGREIVLGDQFLSISQYDFSNKELEFRISKLPNEGETNLFFLNKYQSYSLGNMKYQSFPIAEKEYTVVEFGGSWCKPCTQIIPQIKSIKKKFGSQITIVSILKESNLAIAKSYFKKVNFPWTTYFESLKCNNDTCLASFFDVGIYPTVLFFNKKGELLFRANGSESIKSLETYLKNNNLMK